MTIWAHFKLCNGVSKMCNKWEFRWLKNYVANGMNHHIRVSYEEILVSKNNPGYFFTHPALTYAVTYAVAYLMTFTLTYVVTQAPL